MGRIRTSANRGRWIAALLAVGLATALAGTAFGQPALEGTLLVLNKRGDSASFIAQRTYGGDRSHGPWSP